MFILKHNAYQTDFRMDANGVTPIPAPIHIMTLYLNTSWKKTRLSIVRPYNEFLGSGIRN